uniref:BHLH domain-containing protein n=1 Tax=Hanusia phi TaxID=3032 RepID=A0A7S0E253_9CRYP
MARLQAQRQQQQRDQDFGESDGDSDDDDDQPGQKRARKSGELPDRKEKHKVVEQKRREKTKELLADLQDLLPNTEDAGATNLTMNTVLQCAIDFLTQRQANGDSKDTVADDSNANNGGLDIDVAYRSGFMMASMGIAYAGVDGTILEVNPAFATMLGYSADQRHKLIGRTLFSLTTPQDMQNTLKAVSRLLSGELTHTTLTEHCLRQDGSAGFFSVEMNCLWKNNKAHCIVCFIRPADEGPQTRQSAPSMDPMGGYAQGMGGQGMPGMPMQGIPISDAMGGQMSHMNQVNMNGKPY